MAAAETEKKENNIITLFNVGTKFGHLTNGVIKPYYQAEVFKPFTPSDIQNLADKGFEIQIRTATKQEMNWTYMELGKYHFNNS